MKIDIPQPSLRDEFGVPRAERPNVTIAACIVCVLLFLGISTERNLDWDVLAKWGYPAPHDVWGGAYWGLVTSVFVHIAWWHLALNLYWLVIFGSLCERAMGSARFAAFFLAAAIVSSGFQLGLSSETGHGASGVVYALFGFTWATRGYYRQFRTIALEQNARAFIAWALVCVVVTQLGIMNIGNGAHISGLIFGVGVGAAFVLQFKKMLLVPALVLMLAAGIAPLFWMPWSAEWCADRGYVAHAREDFASAFSFYRRSLDIQPGQAWTLENLCVVCNQLNRRTELDQALMELRKADASRAVIVESWFSPQKPETAPGNGER